MPSEAPKSHDIVSAVEIPAPSDTPKNQDIISAVGVPVPSEGHKSQDIVSEIETKAKPIRDSGIGFVNGEDNTSKF